MAVILRPEPALCSRDYEHIWKKYRFGENLSVRELEKMREQLPVHPVIWCGKKTEEEDVLYVAATLGEDYDRYVESLEKNNELLRAYAADCMGMALLEMLGRYPENELTDRGLEAGDPVYLQPGKELDGILMVLQAGISVNEAGMMVPLKSVVYKVPVRKMGSGSRPLHHSVCSQCEQKACPYREELREEKNAAGDPGAFKYSYGYQRIFGK